MSSNAPAPVSLTVYVHDLRRTARLERSDPADVEKYGPVFYTIDLTLGQYDLVNLLGDLSRAYHMSPEDHAVLAALGYKYEPKSTPPEF